MPHYWAYFGRMKEEGGGCLTIRFNNKLKFWKFTEFISFNRRPDLALRTNQFSVKSHFPTLRILIYANILM